MYTYNAKLTRVIDGDTLDLQVDLGFGMFQVHRFRLLGINAPEMHGPSRKAGEDAKTALGLLLKEHAAGLQIVTVKDKSDKYGRYLATVYLGDDRSKSVNELMIDAGQAVAYDGGKR